jgi:hypothetical protein
METLRPARALFLLAAFSLPATSVLAQTPQPRPAPARPAPPATHQASTPIVDSAHPIMQVDEVSMKGDTLVYGDPAKPGVYVMRRQIAANQTTRPHVDDQDRWITVLKGTLWIGRGDVYSPDKLLPVREGGVAYLPANMHYFTTTGTSEVILQINGAGPVRSTHTEVDAKGQRVPENGPYPEIAAGSRRQTPADPDLIDPDQQDALERAAYAKRQAEAKAK